MTTHGRVPVSHESISAVELGITGGCDMTLQTLEIMERATTRYEKGEQADGRVEDLEQIRLSCPEAKLV